MLADFASDKKFYSPDIPSTRITVINFAVGKQLITTDLRSGEVSHYYRQLSYHTWHTCRSETKRRITHTVMNKNNRRIVFHSKKLKNKERQRILTENKNDLFTRHPLFFTRHGRGGKWVC
jgi:hypothetical protein